MRHLIKLVFCMWAVVCLAEVDSELFYQDQDILESQPDLEIALLELEESPVAINYESIDRLLIIPGIEVTDLQQLKKIITNKTIYSREDLIREGMTVDIVQLLDQYISYSRPPVDKVNLAVSSTFEDSCLTRSKIRLKIRQGDVESGILLDRRGGEPIEEVFHPFYFKYDHDPWQCLTGQYSIRWGQGILHAPVFRMGYGKTAGGFFSNSKTIIKPYTSSYENRYFSGMAVQYHKGSKYGMIYFSEVKLAVHYADSMLISSITDGSDENEYYTLERCAGALFLYDTDKFDLGLLAERYRYSEDFEEHPGRESLVNYSSWIEFQLNDLFSGGEFAFSDDKWAGSFILRYGKRKFRQYLLLRSYQENFPDLQGSPVARKSHFGGEQGIYYGITLKPGMFCRIDVYADLYKFPAKRYLIDLPSGGSEEMLNLKYGKDDNFFEISGRYRKADQHVAIEDSSMVVPVVNGSAQITLGQEVEHLALRSRISFRWEENTITGVIKRGLAIYQQAGSKIGKSNIWMRITVFRGELPLYLYENNLRFSNKQVYLTGDGYRASMMLTLNWRMYKGEIKYYYEQNDTGDEQGLTIGIMLDRKQSNH